MIEITPFHQLHPGTISEDALAILIRNGAQGGARRRADADERIERFRTVGQADGKRRVVRNGYLPEREIQAGASKLAIKQPGARVKGPAAGDSGRRNSMRSARGLSRAIVTHYFGLLGSTSIWA